MTLPRNLFCVLLVAVALTVVFWGTLWLGGGLIGGDIYPYYLPQKSFLADRLQAGELPLWNNLAGHGYPLVAESQTGVAYPLHWLFYGTLDVNTAYSAIHLLHYVLAFVFTAMYARTLGLSRRAGLFAALVFVYGWFPVRSCLEWAIIGGAWLPLALWSTERFLQSRQWRFAVILIVSLAFQMLPGHFNLAFITQLLLMIYVPARLWWANEGLPNASRKLRRRLWGGTVAALLLAFLICAVQLLPTWELKRSSQRAAVGERHEPRYGHIPPVYWTQAIAPWHWYLLPAPVNAAQETLPALNVAAGTNEVEAHLYFGQAPLALLLWSLFWPGATSPLPVRFRWLWGGLAAAALVYTSGWPLAITQHLPGFSFFAGPGRFGIITTLAVAVLSAGALDALLRRRESTQAAMPSAGGGAGWLIWGALFALTAGDFYIVSRLITYTTQVQVAPVEFRERSWIRKTLLSEAEPPRMWAPGANLPTLTGIAAAPPYLGIGPAQYYDPELVMPAEDDAQRRSDAPAHPAPGQVEWLRRAGVTHLLRFEPLSFDDWPVELIGVAPDEMLNRAWARSGREPLYLYRLRGSRGRTSLLSAETSGVAASSGQPEGRMSHVASYSANRVEIEVETPVEDTLVLTDLLYPGWSVTVDDRPAEALLVEGMYRGVRVPPGRHRVVWKYAPASVYWGAAVSAGALLLLAALLGLKARRPHLFSLAD